MPDSLPSAFDGGSDSPNQLIKGAILKCVDGRWSFKDGTATPGELVGRDSYLDLAVIHVNTTPNGVQPVTLGDSDNLRIGQIALAIERKRSEEALNF